MIKKLIILIKNDKIINKNIKVVKLEILKVKRGFGIRTCKLINLLSKTDDFIKINNLFSKTDDFIKMINLFSKTDDCIKNDKFA